MEIRQLTVGEIQIIRDRNPRKRFSEEHIRGLAESISIEGLRNPIIVQLQDGQYKLIAGACRLKALRKKGITTVSAVVHEDISEEKADILALADNVQCAALNPLDISLSVKKLKDKYELTQDQLAEKLSKSQKWVSEKLSMAENLSPEVQRMLERNVLKQSYAREVARLPIEDQYQAASWITKNPYSTTQAKNYVNQLLGSDNPDVDAKKLISELKRSASILRVIAGKYYKCKQSLPRGLATELSTAYHDLAHAREDLGIWIRHMASAEEKKVNEKQ